MNISDQALEFLERWEGCKLKPYADSAGKTTIGIGHLLTVAEKRSGMLLIGETLVPFRSGITRAQADALLLQDLPRFTEAVETRLHGVPLKPHEFDALVVYAFNIGTPRFNTKSSVPTRIKEGRIDKAVSVWKQWNKQTNPVTGALEKCEGLTKRRNAEIKMFLKADYSGRP